LRTWYIAKPTPSASPRASKRILPSGVSTHSLRSAFATAACPVPPAFAIALSSACVPAQALR
jgi:hypothetical protein